MEGQPEIVQQAISYAQDFWGIAKEWLLSPPAWSQFALLVAAYLAAVVFSRKLKSVLTGLLTPPDGKLTLLSRARLFILQFLPLLLPLLAYVFIGMSEGITRSIFGTGEVIAFGKRLFLVLAAYILVRDIIKEPFLKALGRFILLPVAALNAVGLLDLTTTKLESTIVPLGGMSFDMLWLLRGVVVGGVVFWLGRWSNDQSATYIEAQKAMRPATRQLAVKAVEIAIFGVAFLILMNFLGISLTSLAVLGGAIGVGLGFGLQKIAANFISGVILLLEGQTTVGDYVELDNGEAGTIVKTTARAMILETFDGRWIVVPNEDFITTRVVNYSDQGSANRYEAPFSVSYDVDINIVPDIVEKAVATHSKVLDEPYPPDCELRGFGDSGVDFAVEFWVHGLDDGENKFTSDVLFLIWNALKDHNIEIPYPQRVVHHKGLPPKS